VPLRVLKAIVPDLSGHSSSTGTSYYVQQRTALFARVALTCAAAGLVIRTTADLIKGHLERVEISVYICLAFSSLSFLGLWLFSRRRPRPQRLVRLAELAAVPPALIAASLAFRLATPNLLGSSISFGRAHPDFVGSADPGLIRVLFEFSGLMLSLLVATQILAIRAALVPSSLKHSLALAAMVGLPICICTAAGWPPMLPPPFALAPDDRGFLFVFGINWWMFTGAACGVMARVVHRLQSEVQVAKRLGQYELGEKVGQGGMGIVYRARHALMKRPVAIKLLPPEAAGQNAIRRFEREVQLTSQLSHPNTVVIHDYGRTHEGVFYYVMEFVEGATLDQVSVASGPMPSGRVVRILEMVAGALGEAHEHGLVHRDVKPANILLGPRGGEPDVVKVLDFGLVRAIRAETDVTDANVMVGTPLFMSPEAMREPDKVDGRSDLYSLGAVAYYLLSGHHVFDGKTALDICAKHIQDAPKPLTTLVPDIDLELEKIVLKCLEKEPANRFSSARELCQALSLCPSRKDWTPDKARAWWAIHTRLLHPVDPSNVYATGEFASGDTEQRVQ
jgi:hypothetical protein